jgi:hypothetical protein
MCGNTIRILCAAALRIRFRGLRTGAPAHPCTLAPVVMHLRTATSSSRGTTVPEAGVCAVHRVSLTSQEVAG